MEVSNLIFDYEQPYIIRAQAQVYEAKPKTHIY